MRRRAPALCAAAVLGLVTLDRAGAQEEAAPDAHAFSVAPWTGSAFYSDDDGRFSHCLMAAQFDRQMSLVIALDRHGGTSIGVRNPRWALALMEQQLMQIWLGGSVAFEEQATAVDSSLLLVRFAEGMAMLERLGHASLVSIAQGGQTFQFLMVNGAQAIAALEACTAAASAPPPDPDRRPTLAELDRPDTAPEPAGRETTMLVDPVMLDQAVARNFLGAAGLDGFTLMTPDEQADFLGGARAAWTDGSIWGALYTVAPRVSDLGQATEQTLKLLEGGCEGVFTWSAIVVAGSDGRIERRAAVCDETDFAMLFRLTAINGETGTLVVLHAGLREAAAGLAEADDKLVEAIREGQIQVE